MKPGARRIIRQGIHEKSTLTARKALAEISLIVLTVKLDHYAVPLHERSDTIARLVTTLLEKAQKIPAGS